MNKPSNASNGATQAQKSEQPSPAFSNFKPSSESDSTDAAKDSVHQVSPPDVIKAPAADAATAPLQAAKGNDEIMSQPQKEQQQQMSMPSAEELKGKWKQHVGAAKIAWGKLTEDEFLKLEGDQQKLTGLVQERYAITRDEADKQVKAFFDKNKS